ncbi:MAG: hypothetical protein WCQ99_10970, partial [Pseudomonadota bacterium]
LDTFNTRINFATTLDLVFSVFNGNGSYFPIGMGFVGAFYAIDQSLSTYTGDIIMLITGITLEPYIYGAGFLLGTDGKQYPFVFNGKRVK